MYEHDDRRGLAPAHVEKVRRILARLDAVQSPQDMALPGYRLHPLRGELAGHWAVWVSENWRVTFRFDGVDVRDVDYTDYH